MSKKGPPGLLLPSMLRFPNLAPFRVRPLARHPVKLYLRPLVSPSHLREEKPWNNLASDKEFVILKPSRFLYYSS